MGRGQGLGSSLVPQRSLDMLDRGFNVEHRSVRNSENSNPQPRDRLIARVVILPLILMNTPVELDGQFCGRAIKIDHVLSDDLLTAKMKSFDRVSPNRRPESALRGSHLTPQFFREGQLLRADMSVTGDNSVYRHRVELGPDYLTPNPFP